MSLRPILCALAACLSLLSPAANAVTCAANVQPSNPDTAYTDNHDGTVTHRPTGLMWKRCSEGQNWDATTIACTGTASTGNWSGALLLSSTNSFAGHADWRLPNLKELRSLVEECRFNPSINDTLFPATPSSFFWSGSPRAYFSSNALSVNFSYGYAYGSDRSSNYSVRLVRAGQFFDNLGVAVPAATTITPTSARLDIPQTFTITGTKLTAGMGFAIEDCEPETGPGGVVEVAGGTDTQRQYRCVPRLPGAKVLHFKATPGAATDLLTAPINIDHPARLGNPAARGIPAVNGVSLWNGNVHLEATDLAVPGKGLSFALTRSYNSYYSPYEDNRGAVSNAAPWRFNWDLRLGYVGANTKQIWVEREDGSGENFFKDTDNLWYPMDQGNFNQIKGDFNGQTTELGKTTLLTREGLQYVFYNPDYANAGLRGRLVKLLDHDGNALTVSRDASNRVARVTDSSNRVYDFAYDTNGRLWRVNDFTGRYVEYSWETTTGPAGTRLKTVRDVLGGVTTYSYSLKTSVLVNNKPTDQWLLTSVIDPVGNLATPSYNARSFTYTDLVYGNWGAASVSNALNQTWTFSYCAKQLNGTCTTDPTTAQGFETSTTPPLGASTLTRFDTGGRKVEQVDANAKTAKTTPVSLVGLASKNYNLAALASKRQSALAVAGGYGTDYSYTLDNAGNLANQTVPQLAGVNATTTRLWNTDAMAATLLAKNLHRVNSFADAKGAPTASTYTASGNLLTHTPPGLPATTLGYNASGQVTSVLDARGNSSTREYDAQGNLTKATEPGAPTIFVKSSYDSLGRVLTSTDKRGAVSTNTWDAAGRLTSVKDALNGLVSYQYDANGNRIKMTDARNNDTSYSYDALNRLKTVSRVLGGITYTTTTNYDTLGRVSSTVNANNHANSSTFDDVGNLLTRANALADTTRNQYDDDNRVTRTTDPDGRLTDTTYDRVGRVKTVTTAAATATPLTTSYNYDLNGRMVGSTDPRGLLTQYEYDPAGRLITVTDAKSQITRATYDENGNLRTVLDPNLKTTTYTYDAANRPLTRQDHNGQLWTTTYDKNGNVLTQTAPGPKTTTFSYDALNRVTRVGYPDTSVVTYTYDANGNRLSMADSTGTTRYTYDAFNRMSSTTDPTGYLVLTYGYDGVGNVVALGYPWGPRTVNYGYDAGERLTSLTDWLGKTTTYTLNRAGQVTDALFGNGTRVARVFDASGRMTSLINSKPDASVISSHGLTLDGDGNISNSVAQLPLQPALPNVNRAFTYDGANRLLTANGAAVVHDLAGRITTLNGDNYSYNDRDQVTGISGTQTASYVYNGDGHRVARNLNGQTTHSLIDPNRNLPEVVYERNDQAADQNYYVYGYGLVEHIDAGNNAKYYHFDPTGSTLALTQSNGMVVDSYAYSPYGETTTVGTTRNPFKYVGKLGVMDDGNGLHYMRARYYRADVGRFLSLDALAGSVGEPQTLNRYAYSGGNPVTRIDPTGKYWADDIDRLADETLQQFSEHYDEMQRLDDQAFDAYNDTFGTTYMGAFLYSMASYAYKANEIRKSIASAKSYWSDVLSSTIKAGYKTSLVLVKSSGQYLVDGSFGVNENFGKYLAKNSDQLETFDKCAAVGVTILNLSRAGGEVGTAMQKAKKAPGWSKLFTGTGLSTRPGATYKLAAGAYDFGKDLYLATDEAVNKLVEIGNSCASFADFLTN